MTASTGPRTDAPASPPPADGPAEPDIPALRQEIDRLDAAILELVQQRTRVSREIGRARMASGGPRVVHSREMAVLHRFRVLGREGQELGMVLLRLGRGRPGRQVRTHDAPGLAG